MQTIWLVRSSSINDLIEVCFQDDVLFIDHMILFWSCGTSLYLSFRTSLYSCLSFLYMSFCNYCSSDLADFCLMLCSDRDLIENPFAVQNNYFFNLYMFMPLYVTHVSCVLRLEIQHLSTWIYILLFFNEKSCMFTFLWGLRNPVY
jgi:hypothetical protein